MIAVVYGTTGELIKLAALLRRLEQHGHAVLTVCTGQQIEQIPAMLTDLGLEQPDIWLRSSRRRDLERPRDVFGWLAEVIAAFVRRRTTFRGQLEQGGHPILIVHGDTFTTLLGALIGRALRVPVAHVEAGMRSGTWRNPFPEEVIRRLVSQLVPIHFAPGERAVANLRAARVRGTIVDTRENTIRDSLELAHAAAPAIDVPAEPFGLVSLHRFELLEDERSLRKITELLHEASRRTLLLFIDHPVTAAAIEQAGLAHYFDARLRRIERRGYTSFVALLKASQFMVTDSGGSQEECAYLGHPCLVHRAVTEHTTGLDGSVVLSRMDLAVVERFLENPQRWRTDRTPLHASPTDIIVSFLRDGGFLPRAARDGLTTPRRDRSGR